MFRTDLSTHTYIYTYTYTYKSNDTNNDNQFNRPLRSVHKKAAQKHQGNSYGSPYSHAFHNPKALNP